MRIPANTPGSESFQTQPISYIFTAPLINYPFSPKPGFSLLSILHYFLQKRKPIRKKCENYK